MKSEKLASATGVKLSGYSEKDYKIKDFLVTGNPVNGYPETFIYEPIRPTYNQDNVGSCVAHALALLTKYQEKKERGYYQEWSRNFIYHNRSPYDTKEEGMYVRYAYDQLKKDGVCEYKYFTGNNHYGNGEYKNKITQEMRDNAKYQKIKSYATVNKNNANEIKKALITNGIMTATIPCYTCFGSFYPQIFTNFSETDYVKFNKNDTFSSYHHIVVLGYRDTKKGMELYIQNSWSDIWGDKGCAWLSYDFPIEELWTSVDEYLPPPTTERIIEFKIGSYDYFVNGEKFTMDTVPVVKNERTMIPARFLATALSCSIDYIKDKKDIVRIFDISNNNWIDFYVNDTLYFQTKTGKSKRADVETYVDNNYRTMMPLRALAECLDFEVEWIQKEQKIILKKIIEVK